MIAISSLSVKFLKASSIAVCGVFSILNEYEKEFVRKLNDKIGSEI